MSEPIKLPSGALLEIKTIPFEIALDFGHTVAEELKQTGVKLGDDSSIQTMDASILIKSVLQMVSSKAVERNLWECFKHCHINKRRVDKELFAEREARRDFIPASVEVMKEVLLPFFADLNSEWLVGVIGSLGIGTIQKQD